MSCSRWHRPTVLAAGFALAAPACQASEIAVPQLECLRDRVRWVPRGGLASVGFGLK